MKKLTSNVASMTPRSANLTPACMTLSVVSNMTLLLGLPAISMLALQMFSPDWVKKNGHEVSILNICWKLRVWWNNRAFPGIDAWVNLNF